MTSTSTFVREFDCDRACRVELDLTGCHSRFTFNQMSLAAEDAHRAFHAGRHVRDGITVTSARKAVV